MIERETKYGALSSGAGVLGQISDRTAQIKKEINKIIITTHKHVQLIQIKFYKWAKRVWKWPASSVVKVNGSQGNKNARPNLSHCMNRAHAVNLRRIHMTLDWTQLRSLGVGVLAKLICGTKRLLHPMSIDCNNDVNIVFKFLNTNKIKFWFADLGLEIFSITTPSRVFS